MTDQGGSLTVELVLLAPVLVLFALMAVAMGRYEVAREQIVDAARAGAEAASVAASPGDAQLAASSATIPEMEGLVNACTGLSITTDTEDFVPGGTVSVAVTCRVHFSGLFVPGVPGSATVRSVQSAPIDPYRSVQ